MQYLVRKIHHTTDEVFLDATKAKENETFVVVDAESAEEAKERVKDKKQCFNCGSWDTEYEYLFVNNIPIHLAFSCNNCNKRYGKELVGDEKGYSIKLKAKDSE